MTRGTRSFRPAAKQSVAALYELLGPRLRAARLAAGLTQVDVAEAMQIAPEVYGRMERGLMIPSLPTFYRLCTALNVDANTLLQPEPARGEDSMKSLAATAVLARKLPDTRDVRRILHRMSKATPAELRAVCFVLKLLTKQR